MPRERRKVHVGRALVLLGLVFAAILGAWTAIQGPVTVYRIVVHGDTTIEDHKLYPFRPLAPSPRPFRFKETPRPELARVTVAGLGDVDLAAFLGQSDTIALLVLKGDRLLFERYFRDHERTRISQAFSASKSILSLLIGAAIDDGLIRSVDDVVTDYVPELARAGFEKVRIVDLLQMNSSIDYVEDDNPFGQHVRFNYTPKLEAEILSLRVKPARDGGFVYKSGDNALLGLILKRVLRAKTITQFTQERLWDPLGMEHAGLWSLDDDGGMEKTWCCISATARDFAKIGALCRDGGQWLGQSIVSSKWIEDSTKTGPYSAAQWPPANSAAGFRNFGYQWWLLDKARGDFTARGKDGQFIYVDAARDVVVVRLGYSIGRYNGRALGTTDWMTLFQALADKAASLQL
jgi:CubicO group peptidase (beta-lactamase class C family)